MLMIILLQVYTDVIRRVAERHGPKSPQVYKTIHELDDLLQARLIDARSKEEQLGRKVREREEAMIQRHASRKLLYFRSTLW